MRTALVVPCYNEAARFNPEGFLRLVSPPSGPTEITLLLVDDGSRDATRSRLEDLRDRRPDAIRVMLLDRNQGKAEAVRQGLRASLADGAEVVGYCDADLATPPEEVLRLVAMMQRTGVDVLLASRVLLLGREIERRPSRHYLGRVFATAASRVLGIAVYDTQCGAKLFRRAAILEQVLSEPFLSRWIFDIELLGRLLIGSREFPGLSSGRIVEEPLQVWRDIPGSKLGIRHMIGAARDLMRIRLDLHRRRKACR